MHFAASVEEGSKPSIAATSLKVRRLRERP